MTRSGADVVDLITEMQDVVLRTDLLIDKII